MPQNAFFPWSHDLLVSQKNNAKTLLSTLHPLSPVIFATATVLAFVLLHNSRFNFHCYTQREATPTQKSARKWCCDLSQLLAQKITRGIHSRKPVSLNRWIMTKITHKNHLKNRLLAKSVKASSFKLCSREASGVVDPLTWAWYCSRTTQPGNSGSGTLANRLIISCKRTHQSVQPILVITLPVNNPCATMNRTRRTVARLLQLCCCRQCFVAVIATLCRHCFVVVV